MQMIPIHRIPVRSCKGKGRAQATVVAYATVDDCDAGVLGRFFWTIVRSGHAQASIHGKNTLMHHLVLPSMEGVDVSHLDGNPLNNTRNNLRYASRSKNMLNRNDALCSRNTSGFRGVTRDDKGRSLKKPWRGKVTIGGKTHQTARFEAPELAHEALVVLLSDLRVQEFPEVPRG